MKFANKLYIGSNTRTAKEKILANLKQGIYESGVYLIMLSDTEGDLLEALPVTAFNNPAYCKYNHIEDYKVVGLAESKSEARDLLADIVMDIYKKTGTYEVKQYFVFD